MLYQTFRDTNRVLALALALGLALGSCSAFAQDAAWDGLINAGRAALQQDNFSEAERHFESALETAEKFSPGDPRLGRSLNNLAAVYYKQQAYDRAEPLMRRSLTVLEESLGPSNADVAQTKKNLAAIYYLQGNYTDAEPLLKQSLSTLEELHGPSHAFVATVLNNLAALYQAQDRYTDAEPLLSRSLEIWEGLLGKDHQDVVKSRELLARLRETNGLTSETETPQKIAGASPETTRENAQSTSEKPAVADQIIALAAEAEAAAIVESVGLGDGSTGSVDQAAKALADLSASETAAAAVKTEEVIATNEEENSLPVARDALSAADTSLSPGKSRFAVYLSTLWSKDEAERYWQALKQEIPNVLAGKEMEIEEIAFVDGKGSFYRVLTSPFTSDPAAQAACDEIKSQVRTHDCNVIAR